MSAQRDIDDTLYCPMCEDAAKKIREIESDRARIAENLIQALKRERELEQRVKVLTDALLNIMDDQHAEENRYVFLTAKHALFPTLPKENK